MDRIPVETGSSALKPARVQRLLPWLAAPWLIGLLVVGLVSPRSGWAQTVGDLSITAATLLALAGCVKAARRPGPAAAAWAVLAVAVGLWTAGQLIWTFHGLTLDHLYPFPSLADIGFIGYAPMAAAGLLLFPRSSVRRASRLRTLLDAGVIGGSVLLVSWATVLGPMYHASGSGLPRLVGLAYPLVDVALASLVMALGMAVPSGQRRPWLLLGSGIVLLAATDSLYAWMTLQGMTGTTGTPMACGWTASFLLVAAASQVRQGESQEGTRRHFTVLQELLPFPPLLAAIVTAAGHRFEAGETFLIVNAVVLVVLLAAHQLVTAVEKVQLASGLEETINQRTAELTSADARFRALVQSSDDAIFSKTAEGIITSWNAAAERLFGYTSQEVLGRSVDLLVPESRRHEELEIRRLAATGDPFRRSYETERVRKDGVLVPVALTISPIYDGETIEGVSAIVRDITDAKRREQELAAARTAAVEASRAKSEFLATMSHEIRTPMNGVIGLTGLLLRTSLDEVQRRYANGVRGAGEALLAVIDGILDFSKLEAGKIELEEVDFDPRELVEEVGVLLANTANSEGLELIAYCEPSVPPALRGDPGRLRQILLNLAANAVKFTEAGEVIVRVAATTPPGGEPAGTATLRFEVIDTGMGISPEDQERLFEPFSQADASTTRRFGGTGLGLAISRRLVAAMHGEIGVTSEMGVGSTFHFSVRLPMRPAIAPRGSHLHVLRGQRVLIVDDNDTNRLILARQLADWDMRTDTSRNAHAALATLRRAAAEGAAFDVALLDLCMPGMDGLALAGAVAADPALSDTRCMILTSGGPLDAAGTSRAGVREWISKPVRLSELHDALVRLIGVPEDSVGPAPRLDEPVTAAQGSAGRILVVEDNRVNQMVAHGALIGLGYSVHLAGDGLQALAALEVEAFDAVLMDCHMPQMDGFEATRQLRRREGAGHHIPVIAMTAGVLADNRERCLAAGMDDFIAKPVDFRHLRRVLAKWTGQTGSGPSRQPPSPKILVPSQRAALTPSRLDELREIGADDGWGVLPAVITAFLDSSTPQVAELHAAVEAGDHERARQVAHTLRGAAVNIGAEPLAQACADVEQVAARAVPAAPRLVEQVDAELASARAALERVLEQRA